MKLAHLLSKKIWNLKVPFCISTFTSWFLIAFFNVHAIEKQYHSLMYTIYVRIQIIPLTLTLIHTCYEESTPKGVRMAFDHVLKTCFCHVKTQGGILEQN